jgi:shikimate dehydrogenase
MSGRTFAVIGDPVAHSVSPSMQRAAFDAAGLDADYVAERVPGGTLPAAWGALRGRFAGWNVTRPHKESALRLVDHVAPEASACGSVNTVVLEDGRTTGHSTDGAGFLVALATVRTAPAGRALIIGTGGAARAVAAALADTGTDVRIVGRNAAAGRSVADDLSSGGARVTYSGGPGRLAEALPGADLIVNATPMGDPSMPGRSPIPDDVALAGPDPRPVVADLVYWPRRTPLLERAAAEGCMIVEGIEMLIGQGARSFELWTGLSAPVNAMRTAAYRALEERAALAGGR